MPTKTWSPGRRNLRNPRTRMTTRRTMRKPRSKSLKNRKIHLCHLRRRSKILHYLRPLQKYLCLHYLRHKIKWRTWTCLRTMKLMFHPLRLQRNRVKTITWAMPWVLFIRILPASMEVLKKLHLHLHRPKLTRPVQVWVGPVQHCLMIEVIRLFVLIVKMKAKSERYEKICFILTRFFFADFFFEKCPNYFGEFFPRIFLLSKSVPCILADFSCQIIFLSFWREFCYNFFSDYQNI